LRVSELVNVEAAPGLHPQGQADHTLPLEAAFTIRSYYAGFQDEFIIAGS